jgi:thioesterase domain-containing protein
VTGGRVVDAGADTIRDGRQLAAQIQRRGATIMQATPATWRLLIAADWQPGRPLRILCGGETMSPELADQLLARSSDDPVSRCYKDTRNGWGAIALGGVEVVSIEGSHLAMFEEPALSTVAAAIRDRILPDPGTPKG